MAANIMRFLTWKLVLRVFIAGVILGLICLIALFMWFSALARNVPSIDQLAEYEPAITSRVHAGDGALIAEFAQEHRVFVPYESIPTHLIEAFVSAEDKSFFEHNGLDYRGITRGALITLRNKIMGSGGMQGGSTITQQVAKNMVLTSDQNFTRKAREAIIARRMESAFTKGEIMELYLNEIYLGRRSYGVGSAALNYFNKSLPELDLAQAATLAALAQLPGRVNPDTNPERLTRRRNWVLGRMVINGYITNEAADEAKSLPLETTRRLRGPEYAAATYFVQELRKELISSYGEDELETGGLSIRSTIDTGLQLAAQEALQTGLETYDRRHEYRGPFAHIELGPEAINELAELKLPGGSGTWEAGLIARVSETGATLRLKDGAEISMPAEDVAWAAETYATADHAGLQLGDVVLAEFSRQTLKAEETVAPTAEGAEFDDDGNNEAVL
ncbi:MAG: transglycosylase domain-containing protein, partial [Hyphomonadaceae bacterium]